MTNKQRTPRSEVLKMYKLYRRRIPAHRIEKQFGISHAGLYYLFEREGLDLVRDSWDEILDKGEKK